ncbi:MAG: hypothetical protein ACI9VR_003014, partial [Cognaticolwellia sp.]
PHHFDIRNSLTLENSSEKAVVACPFHRAYAGRKLQPVEPLCGQVGLQDMPFAVQGQDRVTRGLQHLGKSSVLFAHKAQLSRAGFYFTQQVS